MEIVRKRKTCKRPSINYNADGLIVIKGRAINIDAKIDFSPVISWSNSLKSAEVNCLMMLDCINAAGLKQITLLFKNLQKNYYVRNVHVLWLYDREDTSTFETAIILADMFRNFSFRIKKMAFENFNL